MEQISSRIESRELAIVDAKLQAFTDLCGGSDELLVHLFDDSVLVKKGVLESTIFWDLTNRKMASFQFTSKFLFISYFSLYTLQVDGTRMLRKSLAYILFFVYFFQPFSAWSERWELIFTLMQPLCRIRQSICSDLLSIFGTRALYSFSLSSCHLFPTLVIWLGSCQFRMGFVQFFQCNIRNIIFIFLTLLYAISNHSPSTARIDCFSKLPWPMFLPKRISNEPDSMGWKMVKCSSNQSWGFQVPEEGVTGQKAGSGDWSSGMILVQGTRGPGFNSRIAPFSQVGGQDGNIFNITMIIQSSITGGNSRMECSIHQLTYGEGSPEKVKQLNLSSGSNIKIYEIKHLEDFVNLRILNLSNNMISVMEGLDNLPLLRILNLEFNRIKAVQATHHLGHLEELYLGYNEVEVITDTILTNSKLRVLHLAYNDIRTLDSISPLYQLRDQPPNQPNTTSYYLPHLTTLSLHGNPITTTINYLTFFKMLIPSLRYMDDKNLQDDSGIIGAVFPQEEVIILREAINKLIDQRNDAVRELETYVEAGISREETTNDKGKQKAKSTKGFIKASTGSQLLQQQKSKALKVSPTILEYLENAKSKYLQSLKNQRIKIGKISQLYTQNLKRQKSLKINTAQNLSPESPIGQNYGQECNKQVSGGQDWLQNNREVMKELRIEDERLHETQEKVANSNRILKYIERRQKSSEQDIYKIILELVLFGYGLTESLSVPECYRLCKRYLIKPSTRSEDKEQETTMGLIEYSETLRKVIYGENSQSNQKIQFDGILKLKHKIRNKGLLQIITQLKQLNAQESTKYSRFEKQKKDFVQQFQKQSKQLSRGWDELKREKERYESQKKKKAKQDSQMSAKREQELRRRYRAIEQEEQSKVLELKRVREKLEVELEKIKEQLAEAEEKLSRKFLELEQFQAHFNQFIGEKQHIKSLEEEIHEITKSVCSQKLKYENYMDRIKQLTLEEGILQNKLLKADEALKQKQQNLSDLQRLKGEASQLYEHYKCQAIKETEKLRDISSALSVKLEELKDYEKMSERAKKNLSLLEQKIRNIQQMEQSKKGILQQMEMEIKSLKQDMRDLRSQVENLDRNLETKREELMRYQVKIQENRLSISNLTDINRSISDMLIRQSELKRSIIELEIENKNLLEMKNNLVDDFRIKNYL